MLNWPPYSTLQVLAREPSSSGDDAGYEQSLYAVVSCLGQMQNSRGIHSFRYPESSCS